MPRSERFLRPCRALFGPTLVLCLVWLSTSAWASTSAALETRLTPVLAMASESMPMSMDCVPCINCRVAPPPSTHGFSAGCIQPGEPVWWAQAPSAPDTMFFDEGCGQARMPVRIVYCRWLN